MFRRSRSNRVPRRREIVPTPRTGRKHTRAAFTMTRRASSCGGHAPIRLRPGAGSTGAAPVREISPGRHPPAFSVGSATSFSLSQSPISPLSSAGSPINHPTVNSEIIPHRSAGHYRGKRVNCVVMAPITSLCFSRIENNRSLVTEQRL